MARAGSIAAFVATRLAAGGAALMTKTTKTA
jgi:hypothetical protein